MSTSLPPSGRRRLHRVAQTVARTSLLSVPAAAGLASVGLEPVGDVMGATVMTLNHRAYGGACGYPHGRPPVVRLGGGSRWSGTAPYLSALRRGYGVALRRLLDEATTGGGDGVVGIGLSVTSAGDGAVTDFLAVGTAVRARSADRPASIFYTDLPGPDVAKLMSAGWVPVALHVACEVGVRHDDWTTLAQANPARSDRVNVEVGGYTELVHAVRASVRTKLRGKLSAAGADGGLLSGLETADWHLSCGAASDHLVRCVAIGTSIARFDAHRRPPPVGGRSVLPLR